MVVFTCSACGESLKKNQVLKHYQTRCRNCEYLTCVDCNKDFWGNDYEKHTKCITEDQKYGGKDFVPKASSNKGELKQESWIEHVRRISTSSQVPPHIAGLMEQLSNYENIPRKKVKFENFVKNSMKLRDPKIINKIWELFDRAQEKNRPNSTPNDSTVSKVQKPSNSNEKKRECEDTNLNEDLQTQKKMKTEEEIVHPNEVTNGNSHKKFKWTKVVKNVLRQYPDKELPLKKLTKKVLKEFKSSRPDCLIEKDELKIKLQNKIEKCSQLEITNDKVILKE